MHAKQEQDAVLSGMDKKMKAYKKDKIRLDSREKEINNNME
jgi:hypothetical protein